MTSNIRVGILGAILGLNPCVLSGSLGYSVPTWHNKSWIYCLYLLSIGTVFGRRDDVTLVKHWICYRLRTGKTLGRFEILQQIQYMTNTCNNLLQHEDLIVKRLRQKSNESNVK